MGIIANLKVHDKEVYKLDCKNKVLLEGDYWGRHFVILRYRQGHPNAYMEVLPDDWIKTQEPSEYAKEHHYDDRYDSFSGNVNGGATYYGGAYWDDKDNRTYIGWDYGHCGDYDAWFSRNSGKEDTGHKWTIIEILMDVVHAWEGFERDNRDNQSWKETSE